MYCPIDPLSLFRKVPGVGDLLARRVVDELHIDSLEALEVVAYDERLRKIAGFGPRRLAIVRAALGGAGEVSGAWRGASPGVIAGCGPRVSREGRPSSSNDRASAV
jgi:hypothetical protein